MGGRPTLARRCARAARACNALKMQVQVEGPWACSAPERRDWVGGSGRGRLAYAGWGGAVRAMANAHAPPCPRTSLWAGVSIQPQTAAARRLRSGLLTWRAHQPMRSGMTPTTMSCAAVQCAAVQCVMVQRYGGRSRARGAVGAGGGSWVLGLGLGLRGHVGTVQFVSPQSSPALAHSVYIS
jgi:hypothetical protein